ncbi:MAG: tetratricopeptide repeat protein [Treponema sp.]|nr:tetratricopeptide repeat protein [Spirochaetia bacterium]MDD7460724.1 tetratricopeptide repeat protein [Spirochaetales bacterium]MDY5812296.1 tetratricopeptide repeat protein [Treponema sp.]MEE1180873.1 tetratricopeptide repeat protein [Treponema sp.]
MAENVLNEGLLLYKSGNYSNALAYFISLPDDCGADPIDLAYYLGLCYSKLKRYDDALLYLEQVVTDSNERKDLSEKEQERILQCRYLLAVLYCLSGRKKLADFELNKLLDIGYKTASVYASLAYIAWEQGNTGLSCEYYEKALSYDGDNPTALNGMGYVLACEGNDLTKALSCCKKALDILPDSAACLDSLGWVYFKMGLYAEAKKYLERAKKEDSGNTIIMDHLAELANAEQI